MGLDWTVKYRVIKGLEPSIEVKDEAEEQLLKEYQDYLFELGVINVLLTYVIIDLVCVLCQYVIACFATYNYRRNYIAQWINSIIACIIFISQYLFISYFELGSIFIISFRLFVLAIIMMYSFFVLLNHYLKKSKILIFSNFDEDFRMISHEYTF